MGQKTHPIGFRLGFNREWLSKWFGKGKDYIQSLHEDIQIRKAISERYAHASISQILIERIESILRVIIYCVRPGTLIGRGGKEREKIKELVQNIAKNKEIYIDIMEVQKPEFEAKLVAENIALQLEKRVAYRRAMRRAVDMVLKAGAKGVKIMCSGRLGGVEIARSEWYLFGRLPLQTLKADIDYAFLEAFTTYGQIGIKVWIYRGDLPKQKSVLHKQAEVK
ncbi:MAG: 30S ribosomal protein S3 [Candidatus Aminicenantia bacterium]